MTNAFRNIQFLLLLVLVMLFALTYHPSVVTITESGVETHGGVLGPFVMAGFLVLFASCFRLKEISKSKTIRLLFIYLLVIAVFTLLTNALFPQSMTSDLRAIAISVMAVIIGWQLKLSDTQHVWIFFAYGTTAVFVGLSQSFFYGSGLAIQDQYFAFQKNTLGPIIGTAALGFSQLAFVKRTRNFVSVLLVALAFIAIVTCALIRARAALLASAIIIVYILFKRYQNKGVVMASLLVVLVVFVVLLLVPDSLAQFFHDSMYAGVRDGNIDSDRMRRNEEALIFISDHLLIGNLGVGHSMSQIHNYPINKLYSYGIVFSLPILLLYFYVIIYAVRKGFKSDITNVKNCGYIALLLPYIVSMAEPTFPFGPGTATTFNFILFGMSLRHSYEINQFFSYTQQVRKKMNANGII